MEDQGIPGVPSEPVSGQQRGIYSGILKVFYRPSEIFGKLTGKTDWLVAFILVAFIGGLLSFHTSPIVSKDLKDSMLKRFEQQMPAEQYEQIRERIESQFDDAIKGTFKWYYPLLYTFPPLIYLFIIAGICMIIGNFAFGGKAGFWIVTNVVSYSGLIALLGSILKSLLIISKQSMYVYTGFALLKPINDGSFVYYLLRGMDFFTIWRIAVIALGLGVVYKMKPKRFAYVLFTVWIVWIIAQAFLNRLLGGSLMF